MNLLKFNCIHFLMFLDQFTPTAQHLSLLFVDPTNHSILLFCFVFRLLGIVSQHSNNFFQFFRRRSTFDDVLLCLEEITCPLFCLLFYVVHLFLNDLLLELDAVYLAKEILVAHVLRLSRKLIEIATVAGEGLVGAGFLQVEP